MKNMGKSQKVFRYFNFSSNKVLGI